MLDNLLKIKIKYSQDWGVGGRPHREKTPWCVVCFLNKLFFFFLGKFLGIKCSDFVCVCVCESVSARSFKASFSEDATQVCPGVETDSHFSRKPAPPLF